MVSRENPSNWFSSALKALCKGHNRRISDSCSIFLVFVLCNTQQYYINVKKNTCFATSEEWLRDANKEQAWALLRFVAIEKTFHSWLGYCLFFQSVNETFVPEKMNWSDRQANNESFGCCFCCVGDWLSREIFNALFHSYLYFECSICRFSFSIHAIFNWL